MWNKHFFSKWWFREACRGWLETFGHIWQWNYCPYKHPECSGVVCAYILSRTSIAHTESVCSSINTIRSNSNNSFSISICSFCFCLSFVFYLTLTQSWHLVWVIDKVLPRGWPVSITECCSIRNIWAFSLKCSARFVRRAELVSDLINRFSFVICQRTWPVGCWWCGGVSGG